MKQKRDIFKPYVKCTHCGGWGYTVNRGDKRTCPDCELVSIERFKVYLDGLSDAITLMKADGDMTDILAHVETVTAWGEGDS